MFLFIGNGGVVFVDFGVVVMFVAVCNVIYGVVMLVRPELTNAWI